LTSIASASTITRRDRRDRRNRRLEWGWAVVGAALAAVCAVPLLAGGIVAGAEAATVFRIRVEGVVAPSSARFIQRAIREAEEANAAALLIELDTPGGLLKSMDDITKAMLNARVPVIVYISPKGARAASAGVFVTYAAHVAAMAPATHLGAAHPVSVGQGGQQDQTMLEKVTNDAVANIRTIARRRGRGDRLDPGAGLICHPAGQRGRAGPDRILGPVFYRRSQGAGAWGAHHRRHPGVFLWRAAADRTAIAVPAGVAEAGRVHGTA